MSRRRAPSPSRHQHGGRTRRTRRRHRPQSGPTRPHCRDHGNEERSDEEREPERSELRERLDVEAVRVADALGRVGSCPPQPLERAGAATEDGMVDVDLFRGLPELDTPVAREAEQPVVQIVAPLRRRQPRRPARHGAAIVAGLPYWATAATAPASAISMSAVPAAILAVRGTVTRRSATWKSHPAAAAATQSVTTTSATRRPSSTAPARSAVRVVRAADRDATSTPRPAGAAATSAAAASRSRGGSPGTPRRRRPQAPATSPCCT